jgi:microcystin degradation protein MlrC
VPVPRVAILGVILESNRQAPVADERDFRDHTWLEGTAILEEARKPVSHIAREAAAFVQTMDATGPWEPIPVVLTASHPAGPIDGALMDRLLAMIRKGLAAAGPLDAVYIANHGGMIGTDRDDTDGEVFALAREIAGAKAKIVATLDLHANISEVMVAAVDLIVGYRTNPHVDMIERGEEAALALRLMLAGKADPKSAFIRLPLTPASVSLLTASGPYGDLIDLGVRRRAEAAGAILNVSIFGGFVFSDSEKNGVAIIVTARHDKAVADALARDLAVKAWDERQRFVKKLTPLNEALKLAREQVRKPVIFSDAGDNPGGGGTGRTTELLSALVWSGAENVLIGAFFDPPLAEAAHRAGIGATFRAVFNGHKGLACDAPFEANAEVVALHEGVFIGRLGLYSGRALDIGRAAALRIGGVTAIVISRRYQCADPMFFEIFGLDIAAAHTVAVKSRGHFRAGFLPFFPPERVIEVDTVGLTSPVLERIEWTRLPRPVFPIDADATWAPMA